MADATPWQRIKQSVREVLPSSGKTCIWMIKITVIVSFAMMLLKYFNILPWISDFISPVFKFFGLPGATALAYLSGYFVNCYSAIAVITSLELDWRATTIIATMVLCSHSMIIETAVLRKTGANATRMVIVRTLSALFLGWLLNRTSVGLNLRAVGENPATADAAGINVTKYKYVATCTGAAISGLGGLYYVMDYINGTWANDGNIEALGWLAVALVIFATWKPARSIWGAYLFGALYWLYNFIPGLNRSSQEIFKMLPYAVTIVVLVSVSLRHKREDQPPMSLGLPYFREER